ncbi:ThuA domain-containing protein [uncultured Algibacter sp.]|uniref:ThuA domain-containing protein n=1 Tax=uncultured Algibacter sp. TaxID=298659 RepID=UPI0026118C11|nr:ThuA domain-containing protein [uncultured Algibacter sp.]
MRLFIYLVVTSLFISCSSKKNKPIKALLITGGCCHNYEYQKKKIQEFTTNKINIEWEVLHEGGDLKDYKSSIYNLENWSSNYDVVVHNECFGKTKDDNFIKKVVDSHLKSDIGIVMLHCAMHTYREGNEGKEAWTKMIGLESKKHDHQDNYIVKNVAPQHPIMKNFPKVWKAPKDELYVVAQEFSSITPLAKAKSFKDSKNHTCIWTNKIEDNNIFGITFGHNNETFESPEFQEVFNRGLLWATGRLK